MSGFHSPADGPANVIVDTDMATDCDDAGALAVCYALERRGETNVLATVTNNRGAHSAGALAAINAFYGRSSVPIGAYKGDAVGTEAADFFVELARDTDTYGHAVTTRDDVARAVDVYRKVLADADDDSVVVVSIGHLINLYALLQSGPGRHSDADGKTLIDRKVDRAVVMGGNFPAGKEHNFAARGSAPISGPTLDQWPTPVLFTGYELGVNVHTGAGLTDVAERNPVRRAYAGHPSNPLEVGRPSWDMMAVLAAVREPERYWEVSEAGRVVVDPDGSNTWHPEMGGRQRYLIERDNAGCEGVSTVIEGLMGETP